MIQYFWSFFACLSSICNLGQKNEMKILNTDIEHLKDQGDGCGRVLPLSWRAGFDSWHPASLSTTGNNPQHQAGSSPQA